MRLHHHSLQSFSLARERVFIIKCEHANIDPLYIYLLRSVVYVCWYKFAWSVIAELKSVCEMGKIHPLVCCFSWCQDALVNGPESTRPGAQIKSARVEHVNRSTISITLLFLI